MSRYNYFIEDLQTGTRWESIQTMKAAKALAKQRSLISGHAVGVVAVDSRDRTFHPQGAYYGRSWREGAYHWRRENI